MMAFCETEPVTTWEVTLDPEGTRVPIPAEATWDTLAPDWLAFDGKAIWPVVE